MPHQPQWYLYHAAWADGWYKVYLLYTLAFGVAKQHLRGCCYQNIIACIMVTSLVPRPEMGLNQAWERGYIKVSCTGTMGFQGVCPIVYT